MTQLPIIKDIYGFLGPDMMAGVVGLLLVLMFVPLNSAFLVYVERKVAGHIQLRPGPMEVGPHGILQSLIDAVKLMCKEMITPDAADKPLFWLAPCIAVIPAIVCFVVIPFSSVMQIREMNVGILLIFAFSSISGLSLLMAGWASNNKYSLIAAVRAVAQSIAYEIPLLLSAMSVILMSNSFKMSEIVAAQSPYFWNVMVQPVAAVIFIICSTAETNRAPFDLVEAESELVSGFHTEYTGMRDALFFMAEYTAMFIASSMAVVLFFGGWHGPFFSGIFWFVLKAYLLVFVTVWIRWTFPRLRFDQLMNFAWKVLIPIALVNLLVTAIFIKVF
ncbi:MAG: NADH-quinone oxidoreductase subunit NuoH [Proteobacteria bacterium]|nr:NADH-quinone oxidoreductase subunit NuoH [Pseudomonadota bacterium]